MPQRFMPHACLARTVATTAIAFSSAVGLSAATTASVAAPPTASQAPVRAAQSEYMFPLAQGSDVLRTSCLVQFTTGGPLIDPSQPCRGIDGIEVASTGDLRLQMTLKKPNETPIISSRAQVQRSTSGRYVAGPSGGVDRTTIRIYDSVKGAKVDLRDRRDLESLRHAGVRVKLDFYNNDVAGIPSSVPRLPRTTHVGGCVVRFTPSSNGYPTIHANGAHYCHGVNSVEVTAAGELRVSQDLSGITAPQLREAWGAADESFAARGVQPEVALVDRRAKTTTYRLRDTESGELLDLNSPEDRDSISCWTCNVWLGWTYTSGMVRPAEQRSGTVAGRGD